METKDLKERRFTYHKPVIADVDKIATIRIRCRNLALLVNKSMPDCREKSIAITKIEEVSMWANAGIVREGASEIDNG